MPTPTVCTIVNRANPIGVTVSVLRDAMQPHIVPPDLDRLNLLGSKLDMESVAAIGGVAIRTSRILLNQPPLMSSFQNNPQPVPFRGCVVSESDEDSPSGSGAQTLNLAYIDAASNPHVEAVVLNGTTPVDLTNSDHVALIDVTITAAAGGLANAGRIKFFSGTRLAVAGTNGTKFTPGGVCVAVAPQPIYRLVAAPTVEILTKLYANWMQRTLWAALSTPILSDVPVFT